MGNKQAGREGSSWENKAKAAGNAARKRKRQAESDLAIEEDDFEVFEVKPCQCPQCVESVLEEWSGYDS